MNADKTAATSSAIASMGGYGCAKYENTDEKSILQVEILLFLLFKHMKKP